MSSLTFCKCHSFEVLGTFQQCPQAHKQSGFTLLEVLIALVVFVIAASTIGSLMSDRVAQYEINKELTIKSWIAANKMVEAQVYGATNNSETIEYANSQWQVESIVDSTGNENLNRITIKVSPAKPDFRGAKKKPFTLVSLLLDESKKL